MKKIFIAILMLMPVMAMAQSNWEIPQQQKAELERAKSGKKNDTNKAKLNKADKKAANKAALKPYLGGAVPEVDGKVIYTLDMNVPGKSASEIYDMTYALLEKMTNDERQMGTSKIAIVNRNEHSIIATFNEWLTFSDKLLVLDRTQFSYMINAKCFNGKLHVTFERLTYKYETQRRPEYYKAEEIITDKASLSKDGTKLKNGYIKFRKKTVDRMNELMDTFRHHVR